MNILILGGDGYLGWPTAMDLVSRGHRVLAVDNYLRRRLASETNSEPLFPTPDLEQRAEIYRELTGHAIEVRIGDCRDREFVYSVVEGFKPDAVIHYAEQPSAPYSMKGAAEAALTLDNNLTSTFNLIWAVMEKAPDCHIVKLGTMGEYGTPNIDIEEGWLDIEHKGRKGRFLFPRQAGSLYHTTKILDTDLLWFYVRSAGLRVTDLMQGPVYGLVTDEVARDSRLVPNFHYDDIFGTVLNRFLVQAVAGVPLTIYGKGGQTRGYLNIKDTLTCVRLAVENAAAPGELRIFNQFTETFSVNQLAEIVFRVANAKGLPAVAENMANPRQELEEHYYSPAHRGLTELGLQPNLLTDTVVDDMLDRILLARDSIQVDSIRPSLSWSRG